MKIFFTGGKTGGHFYPIIAVVDALNKIIEQEKIVKADMVFLSSDPYDKNLLLAKGIRFKKIPSGKMRRYFSLLNILDIFKTVIGIFKAMIELFFDFPDVIFSKGAGVSFPTLLVARLFRIPVIIHESDTIPGKVNKWSSKFAKKIAISFPQTLKYFPEKKTALTGNPIRKDFFTPSTIGAKEFFNLEPNISVILIIGGSQGSQKINEAVIGVLPELTQKYQILHSSGKKNFKEFKQRTDIVLEKSEFKSRYHLTAYLDQSAIRKAYAVADLAVSRAGASSIFEISASGLPSILIPLANSAQNHQKENAYAYAETGATDVIEEENLGPHVLQSEIDILIGNKEKLNSMKEAAKKLAQPDSAEKIAREILNLALEHA
jgi:UDP-N-acetylglucosamine--N-acetylmuramyl-(pentapeptide) pyrophosphoryl-undecaprenol N-acetylglucosamine transferase